MSITLLPPAPSRQNASETFADEADVFVAALPTMVTQMNSAITTINTQTNTSTTNASTSTTQAGIATTKAAEAAASALSAVNAPGTNATSTTSLTISIASKSLTVQTGKAFVVGQYVSIASTASPLNRMTGVITAYTSGTGALVVDVTAIEGTGTLAAWTIGLAAGPIGARLVRDPVVLVSSGAVTMIPSTTYVLSVTSVLTLPATPPVGSWVKIINRSNTTTA